MPHVNFDPNSGLLELTGRSIPEFPLDFYVPLYEWAEKYAQNPQAETILNVYLDYFNTTSSECLLDLFRRLEVIHAAGQCKVVVSWRYDQDDETMMDSGEVFRSMLSLPFELIEMDSDR